MSTSAPGTSPAATSPAGTSPAGTSPAGTSPAGTSAAATSPAGMSPAGSVEVDALYQAMAADGLQPLWTITAELLPPQPAPRTVPWLWSGRRLRAHAVEAARLVPVGRGGERRAISLVNPGLQGRPYASSTLWGALQCLGPHESAPAHRHTPGAVRFVLEGHGVWTTVDGDACDMAPGDLVLTPPWTWHDHTNGGAELMLWFDGLDLPIVEALDAVFFEPYPEDVQPADPVHNRSERHRGDAALVPGEARGRPSGRSSPLLLYRWADTDAALGRLLAAGAAPMASVEYADPQTGAPVLPTVSCQMHRLVPGPPTPPTRRTGSTIFVVYTGRGRSHVGDRVLEWERGDMFVCPSWAPAVHQADELSDLFSFSDRPTMAALGLWREETLAPAPAGPAES